MSTNKPEGGTTTAPWESGPVLQIDPADEAVRERLEQHMYEYPATMRDGTEGISRLIEEMRLVIDALLASPTGVVYLWEPAKQQPRDAQFEGTPVLCLILARVPGVNQPPRTIPMTGRDRVYVVVNGDLTVMLGEPGTDLLVHCDATVVVKKRGGHIEVSQPAEWASPVTIEVPPGSVVVPLAARTVVVDDAALAALLVDDQRS